MVQHQSIFGVVLIACAIAGLSSPVLDLVFVFRIIWLPSYMLGNPSVTLFLSMLVTSAATLLVAGVPAALYERLVGDPDGRTTLWIWAACATLLMLAGLAWRFGQVPAAA